MRRRRERGPRLPRDVVVLALIGLCVAIGFGVVAPVLPVFASSFKVSQFAASAVISVFAVMRFVCSPWVGRLDDALGERKVLAFGIGIVALSSALAGLAHSYVQLLVLRGIGGIGSAMFSVSAMTLLLQAAGPAFRGRATALYNSGFLVGFIAGPALGGVVTTISLAAPFFFYAATLVLAGSVGLALLSRPAAPPRRQTEPIPAADAREMPAADAASPELSRPSGPGADAADAAMSTESLPRSGQDAADAASSEPPRPLRQVARDRRFQAACLAAFAGGWTAQGLRSALIPLFVASTMYAIPNEAARWTGIAMAASACVQAIAIGPAGAAVDRLGRRRPMIIGAVISGLTIALLPWSPDIVMLTVILCLHAVGSALMGSAPAAAVGDAAGPHGDRAVAAFSMSSDLASIIGPLVAGAIATATNYQLAFATGSILWAASALVAARMPRP